MPFATAIFSRNAGLLHCCGLPWLPAVADPPKLSPEAVADAEQAARREQHDREEDDPDHRMEPLLGESDRIQEADVADVVVEDDEDEGPDPGALDPVETADHRHHEQVEHS